MKQYGEFSEYIALNLNKWALDKLQDGGAKTYESALFCHQQEYMKSWRHCGAEKWHGCQTDYTGNAQRWHCRG
jgi:hypothetical protein